MRGVTYRWTSDSFQYLGIIIHRDEKLRTSGVLYEHDIFEVERIFYKTATKTGHALWNKLLGK